MANEIIITVKNQIENAEQTEVPSVPTPKVPKKPNDDIKGPITAQLLVGGANRLLATTGNTELTSAISKVSRYGFLAMRIATNPTPATLATLAITLSADALDKITEQARKEAEAENQVDNARIKAGLLDISQTKIKTKWFSGRQTYRRF
jgi:hypothetical protein